MSQSKQGSTFNLLSDTRGYLYFHLENEGEQPQVSRTRPFLIADDGKAIITIRWSGEGIAMNVNGKGAPLMTVALSDLPQAPAPMRSFAFPRRYTAVDPVIINDDAEQLFVATMQELEERIFKGGQYHLIRAAALLRQLLLDGNPLADAVNRHYRLKLKYELKDDTEPLPEAFSHAEVHFIYPDIGDWKGVKTRYTDKEGFLSSRCVMHKGHIATIKDLIKACANARGGVHLGRPKEGGESIALKFDDTIETLGLDPSLSTIRGIALVTLRALSPLADHILRKHAIARG